MFGLTAFRRVLIPLAWCGLSGMLVADDAPRQARDLNYGHALYQYYQGEYADALTTLNVAKLRGGIRHHGEHPLLVEGGLLLTYGMVREAKVLFERVLKEQISVDDRNRAWFYLGKVLYLQGDYPPAAEALQRVDAKRLTKVESELGYELTYLTGQLKLKAPGVQDVKGHIEALPEWHLGRVYLAYNAALQHLEEGAPAAALAALQRLHTDFPVEPSDDEQAEAAALKERVLVSLATLHLQAGDFAKALSALKHMRLDSPFVEQALFNYAVSAANQKQYGLALEALNRLSKRQHTFTPWLQQVPFAKAYLYEQLQQTHLALQHYRDAGAHYETLLESLEIRRQALSEESILGGFAGATIDQALALGDARLVTDAWGRLPVVPRDFSYAWLLADEAFQQALSDLHELYQLREGLQSWEQKLQQFALMLETRQQQRQTGLARTQTQMQAQQADQWQAQYENLLENTQAAVKSEDTHYFMTQEQIDFYHQIARVKRNLALLPASDAAEYRPRIERIERYFTWQLADDFAINRWEVLRPLRELERVMAEFANATARLQQEMASDPVQQALVARVESGHQRVQEMRKLLAQTLDATRARLVARVDQELQRQQSETLEFLKSSRLAQARLADHLYGAEAATANPKQGAAQ